MHTAKYVIYNNLIRSLSKWKSMFKKCVPSLSEKSASLSFQFILVIASDDDDDDDVTSQNIKPAT